MADYLEIRASLDTWEMPDGSEASFVSCAEIYRHALFIYLCAAGAPPARLDDEVGDQQLCHHFNTAMAHLEKLKVDEPASMLLSWPLAVLGCYSKDTKWRDIITARLLQQYKVDGMKNFRIVAHLLDEFWSSGRCETTASLAFGMLSSTVLIG